MTTPSEYQIAAAQARFGFDRIQARNHVISATRAREMSARVERQRYADALDALIEQQRNATPATNEQPLVRAARELAESVLAGDAVDRPQGVALQALAVLELAVQQ